MQSKIVTLLDKLPYIKVLKKLILNQGRYPAGHYYSPIPEKGWVKEYLDRQTKMPINLVDIDLRKEHQLSVINRYIKFYSEIPFTFEKKSTRYYFDQEWFTYFDAISLYSFIRDIKPKKIIEVGSGFSSAVMLDTAELFLETKPQMTFIEPFPERLKSILRESDNRIEIIEDKVQNVKLEVFQKLNAGDILFIDSSHVLKYGSDLHYLLFEIIPNLEKGVFVHFHDIIYPFEYFQNWLKEGRYWNEIYMLRAFLANNTDWKIHFFNSFVGREFKDVLTTEMPICMKNTGGSIYIERINKTNY